MKMLQVLDLIHALGVDASKLILLNLRITNRGAVMQIELTPEEDSPEKVERVMRMMKVVPLTETELLDSGRCPYCGNDLVVGLPRAAKDYCPACAKHVGIADLERVSRPRTRPSQEQIDDAAPGADHVRRVMQEKLEESFTVAQRLRFVADACEEATNENSFLLDTQSGRDWVKTMR